MLKQLVNECVITLHIIPEGPILIKSGFSTISGPDMAFVKVWRNGAEEVYLPGSSIKGVLRSHAERIARTLRPDVPGIACSPFPSAEASLASFCGACFEKRRHDSKELPQALEDCRLPDPRTMPDKLNRTVYADSCPICRLFGSTWFAGRLAVADAYVVERAPSPQTRDGVGIDRFTGGAASGVKFDLEVVTEGRFETTLHLRNVEIWQLGLVAFLLQDLKDGLLRIGASKSRGLGKVRGEIQRVNLYYLGRNVPEPTNGEFPICGVGALIGEATAQAYDMRLPDLHMSPLSNGVDTRRNGLRSTYVFPGDTFPWTGVAEAWIQFATEDYCESGAMAQIRALAGSEG